MCEIGSAILIHHDKIVKKIRVEEDDCTVRICERRFVLFTTAGFGSGSRKTV